MPMTFTHSAKTGRQACQHQFVPSSLSFPTLDQLPQMFSMCSERWISDFLFTTDSAHVAVFLAPMLTENALAYHFSVLRFAPPDSGTSQMCERVEASLVFIPAFSASNISVGFGVQENHFDRVDPSDASSVWSLYFNSQLQTEKSLLFRYVRDDTTGDTIFVHDSPKSNCYKFDYMQHRSSTLRHRSSVLLNRARVQQSLLACGGALNMSKILPAVTYLQSSIEFRACPQCGAHPQKACCCRLELATSKHPYDFENGRAHLRSHVGKFHGFVKVTICAEGKVSMERLLRSHMKLKETHEPEIVRQLIDRATAEHLRKDVRGSPAISLCTTSSHMPTDLSDVMGQSFGFKHIDEDGNKNMTSNEEVVVQTGSLEFGMLFPNNAPDTIFDSLSMIDSENWEDTFPDSKVNSPRTKSHPSSCGIDNLSHPMDIKGWDPLRPESGVNWRTEVSQDIRQ